jgi:1-acyl-sn-glycerol-3-phosphate acyltransferase
MPFLHLFFLYHRYEVKGLENIPPRGAAILAVNHSFATYDGILLGAKIYLETGRTPCGLADNKLFCAPAVADTSRKLRLAPANHANGEKLLRQGELLMLAPGGMREAIRPTRTESFRVRWDHRLGFIRLSLHTQAPIILAGCPNSDLLYDVIPTYLTKLIYKKLKLPFVLLKGLGGGLIPRPIKLTHWVSLPFYPPARPTDPEEEEKVVREFHEHIVGSMQKILWEGKEEASMWNQFWASR